MPKRKVKNRARRSFALTTFRSPNISRFDLEILGDLPQGGVAGTDLIVARAFGPVIDSVGGVPFGASGSPVYVNGKVIGSISTVLSPDFRHVGITPLAAMLALQEEPVLVARGYMGKASKAGGHALPVSAGFRSTRVAEQIKKRFGKDAYIAPLRAPERRQTDMQPGSPVGVALLTGDLKLGFIGTTTLVEQTRVFAFGHPLLFLGSVRYPLTEATIVATGGMPYPSKIGFLGDTIGTVIQDRAAGVLGLLSSGPDNLVALNLLVRDGDRQVTEQIMAQAVPIPSELPFLTYIAAQETIMRAMNRVGSGNASWFWRISFEEGDPLESSAETFDPFDIASAIAFSIFPLLEEALADGRRITSIELDANVRM